MDRPNCVCAVMTSVPDGVCVVSKYTSLAPPATPVVTGEMTRDVVSVPAPAVAHALHCDTFVSVWPGPLSAEPMNVMRYTYDVAPVRLTTLRDTATFSTDDSASSARSNRHAGASKSRHSNTLLPLRAYWNEPAVTAPALVDTVTFSCTTVSTRPSGA